MAKLFLIPTENTNTVWRLAESFLKNAVDEGDGVVTLEQHFDGVTSGKRQLWLVWDTKCRAAMVTEIINGLCFICLLGGEGLDEWLPGLLDTLESWARERECRGMHFYGRKGWVRKLDEHGFKLKLVVMNKEFTT